MEAANDGIERLAIRALRHGLAADALVTMALAEPTAARGLYKAASLHLSRAGTLLEEILAGRGLDTPAGRTASQY